MAGPKQRLFIVKLAKSQTSELAERELNEEEGDYIVG